MENYREIDPDMKMKEYDLGVLYINKDSGTILEDEKQYLNIFQIKQMEYLQEK